MIEWKAVREAAAHFLPKHTATAGWTHRNLSHVEQEGLPPMPKDRGAEQGDVDGPLECRLAFRMVAAETRGRVAAQQATGNLPWIGVDDSSEPCSACKQNTQPRCRESPTFSWLGSLELTTHVILCRKMEALRTSGTFDDGDILCHPILVSSYLHAFDDANDKVGAERTPQKTEVIYYVADLHAAPPESKWTR